MSVILIIGSNMHLKKALSLPFQIIHSNYYQKRYSYWQKTIANNIAWKILMMATQIIGSNIHLKKAVSLPFQIVHNNCYQKRYSHRQLKPLPLILLRKYLRWQFKSLAVTSVHFFPRHDGNNTPILVAVFAQQSL